MKIGLDFMGGDYAPKAAVLGAIAAQQVLSPDQKIVLFGDTEQALPILAEQQIDASCFEFVHCTEVISMGEHPTKAITQKPNSSISVGFQYLKEGKIDSFASAGNTGAMLVGSMFSVRAIEGVQRPAIATNVPKLKNGFGIMLDVGANADCKPEVLAQFGVLGSIFAEAVYGISNPKVGLMNIGEEEEKGNLVSQAAFTLLKDQKNINFIGNIEGRDIFDSEADVIVCDGFTGNIVLKEAEGIFSIMEKRGLLDDYFKRFNYENYGGTPILGLNKTVIIGHGISNEIAIKNMITLTKDVVEADLASKIKNNLN